MWSPLWLSPRTDTCSTMLASVAKTLLSRCWSLIIRPQVRHWQEIQEFHFQDTNKLLLPNLALVKPLLLQSSALEHGLSSKCQLTSSSPRTAILLHLSSELANSADTFNNKWLSATLVSKVFFYKESWADNGLLWKQGRTGQTSMADLSFCIRKLKQSLIF